MHGDVFRSNMYKYICTHTNIPERGCRHALTIIPMAGPCFVLGFIQVLSTGNYLRPGIPLIYDAARGSYYVYRIPVQIH